MTKEDPKRERLKHAPRPTNKGPNFISEEAAREQHLEQVRDRHLRHFLEFGYKNDLIEYYKHGGQMVEGLVEATVDIMAGGEKFKRTDRQKPGESLDFYHVVNHLMEIGKPADYEDFPFDEKDYDQFIKKRDKWIKKQGPMKKTPALKYAGENAPVHVDESGARDRYKAGAKIAKKQKTRGTAG